MHHICKNKTKLHDTWKKDYSGSWQNSSLDWSRTIVNLHTKFTCTFSSIVVILLNNLSKRDLENFKFVYPQFNSDKTEKKMQK